MDSENNRIKENKSFISHNIQQQQVIPVQQSIPIQIQQGIPYQQNVILYTPVIPVRSQQVYMQNQPLIFPQQIQNQPITYPPQPASQQTNDNPIISKEIVNNQKKVKVEEKKKKSPTLKENTCSHCNKTVETELKKRCNLCSCFFYIFAIFIFPIICIFTCDLSVLNQNCCCCLDNNECDCCCDYVRKCPNCGEYIYRDDSCEKKCNSLRC